MRKKIIVRRNLKEELFHKETVSDKIKKYAFDVIIISMMGMAAFLIIQNKINQIPTRASKTEKEQPVQKNKPTTAIDFFNQKTR
jgi:predicted Fe-Mo cluster-binding NifX family protein